MLLKYTIMALSTYYFFHRRLRTGWVSVYLLIGVTVSQVYLLVGKTVDAYAMVELRPISGNRRLGINDRGKDKVPTKVLDFFKFKIRN